MYKALVCTLYNKESEFDSCLKKIKSQSNVQIEHHIIANLSEYNAHVNLVDYINSSKMDFNFIVKIDADSILKDNSSLSRVFDLIYSRKAHGASLKMFDYYSESLITGMNFFTPKVEFIKPRKFLFPDRIDIPNGVILRGKDVQHLEPIAQHCEFPSNMQAYFYGYRRALKQQKEIMQLVGKSYLRKFDEARAWALIGMKDSQKSGQFFRRHFFSSHLVYYLYRKRIFDDKSIEWEAEKYAKSLN
jgi:hypothetical protein